MWQDSTYLFGVNIIREIQIIFKTNLFTACGCDATGSSSLQCADTSGQCTCNAGYKGTKCDAACGCTSPGSSGTACDASTGQCTCNNGYTGTTCATVTSETKFYLKMTIKPPNLLFLQIQRTKSLVQFPYQVLISALVLQETQANVMS